MKRLLESHAGIVLFGTVTFGTFIALATPQMWRIDFPGTLIPIVACIGVGACFGEGLWRMTVRVSRDPVPFTESDLTVRPGFRVLAGILAVAGVAGMAGLVSMVAKGVEPVDALWQLPMVLPAVLASAYVAARGRIPLLKRFQRGR